MALFEEYKNNPAPIVRERANNWAIAIGLQRVDELNVSKCVDYQGLLDC